MHNLKAIPYCPKRKSVIAQAALSGLAVLLALPAGATAGKPDAVAIVKKMVATYKSVSTFQETSRARILMLNGTSAEQSTTFKYRKPDRVAVTSVDPVNGTLEGFADGLTVSIYSGKQNVFTRRTAPTVYQEIMQLIGSASEESLGVRLSQILAPASFIAAKGSLPDEAKVFAYVQRQDLAGHHTYLIKALADPAWVQSLAPSLKVTPRRRDILFWIDTKSYNLVRATIALTWMSTLPGQSRSARQTLKGGFAIEETHQNMITNAPLPDSAFRFIPPRGAIEKFPKRG